MVGVDGTDTSMRATAYAFGLARRQRCRLIVTFVAAISSFSSAVSGFAAGAQAETFEELTTELRQDIRKAAEEHNLTVTFIVRRGDPFEELCDTADQVKADMLVVGASTQAGHRLVGFIATRLVRRGRWPVVVVP